MPETPDLRRRIAEAIALRRNGPASDGRGWFRNEEERQDYLADADNVLAALGLDHPTGGAHRYLSTSCLHGEHAYCQGNTGLNGAKAPARCKFCKAPCLCPCHATPEASP